MYTAIPGDILRLLDIGVVRTVRLRLANNRVIKKLLSEIGIEIEGCRASTTPGNCDEVARVSTPGPIAKRLRPIEALLMISSTA